MQLEAYLEHDDRIVLPLGSTEQHAFLSLATDAILAERVSIEAAEPLDVPVLPALAYGVTPYFGAFPGSPTLTGETYLAVLRELIGSLRSQGFRRVLVVNGHGGNAAATKPCADWAEERPDAEVIFHGWWNAPRTRAAVGGLDPSGTHASWMENFPWTRLAGVVLPDGAKPDIAGLPDDAAAVRAVLGDGSYGGAYARSDEDMLRVWAAGVEETRERIESL
jgi:creatinine amidohydrolase